MSKDKYKYGDKKYIEWFEQWRDRLFNDNFYELPKSEQDKIWDNYLFFRYKAMGDHNDDNA